MISLVISKGPLEDDKQITKVPASALEEAREHLVRLDKQAEAAVEGGVPVNTRRAYELDLACFASWCARHGVRPMPAEPKVIRAYLFELAKQGRDARDLRGKRGPRGPLAHSALTRALAAICRSHQKSGHPSPWKHPVIEEARESLARLKGTAPKKPRHGLEAVGENLLFRVCDLISDDVRGVRDRALILVGWQSGRRQSEIVAARVEHFKSVEGGIEWRIPRSKTDQTGKGHEVALTPAVDERYCPVRAFRSWLAVSKIEQGPVFRGVDMLSGQVLEAALAPQGVARRIQHYVKLLGLDPTDFGGHSLRSGFVTTAAKLGRKEADIMESTGHRDVRTMRGYIRRAGLVEESVGRGLIDEALARRAQKEEPSK